MKKVTVEFFGDRSDEVAKKFYSYLVDCGLEDHLIQMFSGKDIEMGIEDCNTEDLKVLFSCKTKKG